MELLTESFLRRRSQVHYVLLALALFACLIPFSDKAFSVDDTLFVDVARQITAHPLDPYGFKVNWFREAIPIAYETKNPPLASYYLAAAAKFVGWSERALHFAFLLPALAALWGTYRLAERFTKSPLLAAVATLLTPGFLVSANSVMCDVLTLALWLWAIIFWMEGLEPPRPDYLIISVVLISLCALTKYFGAALMPLLAVYSLARLKRLGSWALYLLLPFAVLSGYQEWSGALYKVRLITNAARFSTATRETRQSSFLANLFVSISFVGGCTLPALTLAPFLWPRKKILAVLIVSATAGFLIGTGRIGLGGTNGLRDFYAHAVSVVIHSTFFIAAGFSVLGLAVADAWKHRDADSLLLMLWVFGTFIFTGFVNWSINARTVLPMIPAAGILLARRIDEMRASSMRWRPAMLGAALGLAGAVSIWLTWGDTELANTARTAATLIEQKTHGQPGTVWFMGHWGFQYYMESFGARPVVVQEPPSRPGDFLAQVENSLTLVEIRPEYVTSRDVFRIPLRLGITTMQGKLGAGFYASDVGPLPFAIGRIPAERYELLRLGLYHGSRNALRNDSSQNPELISQAMP